MAYDVARVRGLHPTLGDGWVHFNTQAGMLIPDSVATTVSTAFRGSFADTRSPHPSARRSSAVLEAARAAAADLVGGDPRGVVLGSDRAVLLNSLAEGSSSRAGLGYELVVSRLDDEANVQPWLRSANRYGAKVKWAEVDIESGDLPSWQWESLITKPTRLVAVTAASSTLGTVPDLEPATKLAHSAGGVVVMDCSSLVPYRPVDIETMDADVVAFNASAWGGPPVGALVFRDPAMLEKVSAISLDPTATGPARLELGGHQFAMLAGLVASVEYLAGLDEAASGSRRERLQTSLQSSGAYLNWLFRYLVSALRSLPRVMVIGAPADRIPALSFTVVGIPAERVVQRLGDNGVCATANTHSRVLDAIGVNEIGGAITIGLAHYSTAAEVDQLVRAVASLG